MSEPPSCTRRTFFGKGIDLFTMALLGAGIYPVLAFIGFKVPVQPVRVVVNKVSSVTGFWLAHEFVLFNQQGKQWAVSRKCTHLGCRLNINEIDKMLVCPCHQSRFDYLGKRVAGPAKRDLKTFPVEKTEDGYVVIM